MAFFDKKEKAATAEDDLLAELERETATLDTAPPVVHPAMPPAPPARPGTVPLHPISRGMAPSRPITAPPRPATAPQPPRGASVKPVLSDHQVSKLPLFMKVEEYDTIVKQLNTLVTALLEMEQTLHRMTELEQEEDEATQRWKEQLDTTKNQVRSLLSEMPETGRLRDLVGSKKKRVHAAKMERKVAELKRDIQQPSPLPKKPPVTDPLKKEITGLQDSLQGLQDEMKHMHLEFKMLNSLTQMKSTKAVQQLKQDVKPPVTQYKKVVRKTPWV